MKLKTPGRPMAAAVVLILLALFGAALLTPLFQPDVKFDAALLSTLGTLVALAVNFYLGSSNSSQAKDDKPTPTERTAP
jgi:hypothetical protein